jgi:hypothetical protein
MIFVVGVQRSGTNWLQRIIASHPDVFAMPSETELFSRGIRPLAERFHHGAASSPVPGTTYADREALLDALRVFCDGVFAAARDRLAPSASRIVERTPDHVRELDLIAEIYPDAWFVHIIRDGRDVARSLLAQSWGPDTMEAAAASWAAGIAAARRAAPAIAHYVEVRYEELLASPEEEIRKLFSTIGLDGGVDGALTESGARFNVDPSAPTVAAGKWRERLSADDVAIFEQVAGGTLRDLGYDTAPGSAPAKTRRGRTRRRPKQDGALTRAEVRAGARFVQDVLDKLHRGRAEEIGPLLSADAYVRVVSANDDREGRDAEMRAHLIETLASDEALRTPQLRGDFHPSLRLYTVVASYEGGDRIFALWIANERITRFVYYMLPLQP